MSIVNHANQSQLEVTKQYDQLEKRWNELTELFHAAKQRIIELEEQLRLSIKMEDGKRLQESNDRL